MAKQFSILATDVDLRLLEETLQSTGDVDILSDIATDDLRNLQPLNGLEIPQSAVGKTSLFCYLAPRHIPRMVAAERDSPVKVHIDLSRSQLIEFWRPYYDTRILRPGRLYYQNRMLVHGESVDKGPAFCRWADGVMTKVRRMLHLRKEIGAYVGAHAAAEIASGKLTIVN
ncbi:hypothetical protein [Mitsuaria sp. 7]|uniref:hypothetical protein n=1 Tax=Mitsuaria sp. 7 TaxID=1658665 RepID=UPI0012F7CDD7|nr:hypothetical protein [Mitsuaria sp. 7]